MLAYSGGGMVLEFSETARLTVVQFLNSIKERDPKLYERWLDREGRLRRSLNVFVNGKHIRYRDGMDTELRDGDEVYVIPVLAGG
jgi:molybdopterin synthase sulfur carrier subunit